MKRCNSMDNIREKSQNEPHLKEELIKSLQPTIDLMEGIFERLTLKEESFKTFKAASDEDICELWELLLEIDETLELDDRTKKSIKNKPLKSDEVDFSQVHSLPDPIPTIDKTSYKEFSEIYGTITTEQHRPSLKHQQKDKQTNKMGFSPNAQFAKNVGVVVECYECNRWRILYSKTKLNSIEISNLESLTCNSPMEIPYYSSGLFEDICFQCEKIPKEGDEESNNQVNIEEGYYYYCNECYITVDSKKRRNRKVKLQQSKRRRTDA
ncbi:hypothetical protein GLOIN_2v1489433 [Rhizophagus clarus]|uniref:Uncharacterized protein n=1 Tax=Rhizophagus clarus TaxID=94130 RepID=A0A8H3LAZ4_9GLOM|nr:hypothetical protein GLOIN_2v1489433 [Rhizophagus clarus]